MRFDTKTLELLSRYIDNDLSPLEREHFEQLLAQSDALREELNRYLKNKKAVQDLTPLTKDEYFDTRLLARVHEQESIPFYLKLLRKPIVPIGALTIFMLIFFKLNPTLVHDVFDSQKKSLEAFYAENLKPFLFKSNLTHDDILRFAFNKEIPLNKEHNQVLTIGADDKGNEFLEVKNASGQSLSMDDFTASLKLNENQKKEVAAILDKYSSKIAESVLAGENNSVAVNANLWTYNNQLRAELLNYAKLAGSEAVAGLSTSLSDNLPKILSPVSASISEALEPVYYYISPDTVFTAALDVDVDKIREEIAEIKSTKKTIKDPSFAFSNGSFIGQGKSADGLTVTVDSNYCKIKVPGNLSFHSTVPEFEDLSSELDEVFNRLENFSFSVKVDNDGKSQEYSFNYSSSPDNKATAVAIVVPDKKTIDSLRKSAIKLRKKTIVNADSFFNSRMNGFSFQADSVFMMIQPMLRDSLKRLFDENFRNGMMMFREEMQEWFEKMEEMKTNSEPPASPQTPKKKKKKEVKVIINREEI